MSSNPFEQSAILITSTVFSIYILAIMLRFILQWARADFYNPLSQLLVKITNPPLKPLRRIIPGWGGIVFASIILMLVLKVIELTLITLIKGIGAGIGILILTAVSELIGLAIILFIGMIIVSVILSWIGPGTQNPMVGLLHQATEPVLNPFRRIIPPIGGLDLSPIFAIVTLQIVKIFADWSLNTLASSSF